MDAEIEEFEKNRDLLVAAGVTRDAEPSA